jgi:hypothetical protein
MYDLGLCTIPASFVIMGILGGGIATLLKRTMGVDLRGRLLELAVVLCTLWLSVVSWGLVRGFFGESSACYGVVGDYSLSAEDLPSTPMLQAIRMVVLQPAEKVYLWADQLFLNSGPWLRAALCTSSETPGCFEHLPHASADFVLKENGGEKCAADLMLFSSLYISSLFTYTASALCKHHERQRRRQGRVRPIRGEPRPHQD